MVKTNNTTRPTSRSRLATDDGTNGGMYMKEKVESSQIKQAARPSFIIAGLSLIAGWLVMLQGGSMTDASKTVVLEAVAVVVLGLSIVASLIFFIDAKKWWKVPPLVYILVNVIGIALAYVIYSLRR